MTWINFLEYNELKIEREFAGEIRFGPEYFHLRSLPIFSEFDKQIYGDWFYKYEDLLFLQEWNSTLQPNTNLICIDTKELKYHRIINNVKSIFWEMYLENEKMYLLDKYNHVKYSVKFDV